MIPLDVTKGWWFKYNQVSNISAVMNEAADFHVGIDVSLWLSRDQWQRIMVGFPDTDWDIIDTPKLRDYRREFCHPSIMVIH